MKKQINEYISWIGKTDWELKKFHGDEFTTNKGSSYNAYLIQDEKTVLIDTVWLPYDKEFVKNLKQEIDISKIDAIIMQHGEIDHSGSLVELMREIPDTPIYCTANGVKSIKGQYHQEWNFIPVKTGDTLNIGKHTLKFIEAPMLHWPDTMFTYMEGADVLFSNDGFGQHLASEYLYADEVEQSVLWEQALTYYANILAPFGLLVNKKIQEILGMNLKIQMICPSHGLIWRKNPEQIVQKYLEWANNYKENQITILYDTMWNSTRKMAESIAEGIQEVDKKVTIKIMNTSRDDKTEVLTEVFKSKMILVGSPTVNNGYLHSIAGILEMIRGMKLKNKKAAAFGSYGWSGEAVGQITESLKKSGFEIINDGMKQMWTPDEEMKKQCIEFGKSMIENEKENV
ncbi:MAG: anaerobic nitric oxide reductase flavorubredoxin [Clostridia bacterium]|nr:anaerobic nitric oxide reductase flavorubredoxin [Clostridia bacterium]